jgi:hypothetical protein
MRGLNPRIFSQSQRKSQRQHQRIVLTLTLILIENEGFSPEFIYEAPKGLRLKKNLILKILKN